MKKLLGIKYLYYGKSNRKWFARKIGIANNYKGRWASIDKEVRNSKEEVIFAVLIPFAYPVEQILLLLTSPFKTKMPGSGKTEWRRLGFLDGVMLAVYIICFIVCWGIIAVAGTWAVYMFLDIQS